MRPMRAGIAVIMLAAASGTHAWADTLLLEGIEATRSVERPTRGMDMTTVETRFGAPQQRIAAVGNPPISRWEYTGFIVYFEYDRVVHAAVRRDPSS